MPGIIDWTDAQLGDPARDFAELRARAGSPFAEDVLACYHRPLDEGFHQRLDFLARWLSLMWLALTHELRPRRIVGDRMGQECSSARAGVGHVTHRMIRVPEVDPR